MKGYNSAWWYIAYMRGEIRPFGAQSQVMSSTKLELYILLDSLMLGSGPSATSSSNNFQDRKYLPVPIPIFLGLGPFAYSIPNPRLISPRSDGYQGFDGTKTRN